MEREEAGLGRVDDMALAAPAGLGGGLGGPRLPGAVAAAARDRAEMGV